MSDAAFDFLSWLRERHAEIQELERLALDALYARNDEAAYRQGMAARAECIASLDRGAAPFLATLPAPLRDAAEPALRRFADGGRTALRIGSVFYMSALLYPDEHQAGEPDNMRTLIEQLAGM